MMSKSKVVLSVAVSAALLFVALPGPVASGLDRSNLALSVSFDKPLDKKDYPTMGVIDPLGITLHPEDCKISPACDTIPLSLLVAEGTPYRLIITTSFTHAGGANDIDVYAWQETIVDDESEYEQIGSSATGGQPEIMKLADLDSTSEVLKYYITPLMWTGSSSYSIKVELFRSSIPSADRFAIRSSTKPLPKEDPTTGALTFPPPQSQPEPESSPVKVPGPDGELVELPLVAVKGQLQPEPERSSAPLLIGTIALVLAGGGLFIFFSLRGRRRREAESSQQP